MTTYLGQLAEMNDQAQASYLAEEQREWEQLQRSTEAEQARATRWVWEQIAPALDPSFDAAIVEARQTLAAARADLDEARQALDAHAAARPANRDEVPAWARRRTELLSEAEAFEGIYQDCRAALAAAEDARRVEVLRLWSERGRQAEAELQQLRQAWQERIAEAERMVDAAKARAEAEIGELSQKLNWLRHNRPT